MAMLFRRLQEPGGYRLDEVVGEERAAELSSVLPFSYGSVGSRLILPEAGEYFVGLGSRHVLGYREDEHSERKIARVGSAFISSAMELCRFYQDGSYNGRHVDFNPFTGDVRNLHDTFYTITNEISRGAQSVVYLSEPLFKRCGKKVLPHMRSGSGFMGMFTDGPEDIPEKVALKYYIGMSPDPSTNISKLERLSNYRRVRVSYSPLEALWVELGVLSEIGRLLPGVFFRPIDAIGHAVIMAGEGKGVVINVEGVVMEYMEGMTLEERLKRGAMDFDKEEAAKELIRKVAALEYTGIFHCDISPRNILIGGRGEGERRRYQIIDFSLSRPKYLYPFCHFSGSKISVIRDLNRIFFRKGDPWSPESETVKYRRMAADIKEIKEIRTYKVKRLLKMEDKRSAHGVLFEEGGLEYRLPSIDLFPGGRMFSPPSSYRLSSPSDWWSLGSVIYTMFTGRALIPLELKEEISFASDIPKETRRRYAEFMNRVANDESYNPIIGAIIAGRIRAAEEIPGSIKNALRGMVRLDAVGMSSPTDILKGLGIEGYKPTVDGWDLISRRMGPT